MNKVKTIFVAIVIFGFICIILPSSSPNDSNKEVEQKEEIAVHSINQDVKVSDVRWKLVNAKDRGNILKASESRYPTIAEDKITTGKFIEITMEVENLGTEMKSVGSLKLIDNTNREFIPASDINRWVPKDKEMFLLSNLNPNMPQQFTSIYEIPVNAIDLKVKVGDLSFWGSEEMLIMLGI